MRARLIASFALLIAPTLACGVAAPCTEARPELDRQVAAYRATLEGGLAHWQAESETSEAARAYGADSAAAGAIDRHRRDLQTLARFEAAIASGDESSAETELSALQSSASAHHPEVDGLADAARRARHCTE
ncbi:MAG: hypothetical protein KC619_11615 [Myxococcales bacterium]|nr:hypothetical protein [Myxococcales bacterium]